MDAKADKIVALILEDLADRRGLRQAWDEIDENIRQEIRATWAAIVHKQLSI